MRESNAKQVCTLAFIVYKVCILTIITSDVSGATIDLFKITGTLLPEHVKLSKYVLWDIIENRLERSQYDIEWKQDKITNISNYTTEV